MKQTTEQSTTAASTKATLEPISLDESKRLIELEKDIKTHQQPFVVVANGLTEIRDDRLYRSDYTSFEEYCQKKWGFTKQHAYRLIECAPIAKSNLQVTSLNQARALAKVPATERATVIAAASTKAKSEGRVLTAKHIKEAAQPKAITVLVEKQPYQPKTFLTSVDVEKQPPRTVVYDVKTLARPESVEPKQFDVQYFSPAITKQELKSWLAKATKHERGEFLHYVIASCEIVVEDRADFKKLLDFWFDRFVAEAKPTSVNSSDSSIN